MKKQSIEYAKLWIKQGKPCCYHFGWDWNGGKFRKLTKKEANKMLPNYTFGISIRNLSFVNIDGVETLEFNELPASAMF